MTCGSLEAFTETRLIFLHWNNIILPASSSSSPPANQGLAGYCVQTHPKVNPHNEQAAASWQLADQTALLTDFHKAGACSGILYGIAKF